MKSVVAIVLAVMVTACTPVRSTLLPPYVLSNVQYSEAQIQALAADRCRVSSGPSASPPPYPFTTDGCSLSPNGRWTECCVVHDMAYWCGGPAALRKAADQSLRACVKNHGSPLYANLMYIGVRLGGSPWLPFPWRWGYGFPWLHGVFKDAAPDATDLQPEPFAPTSLLHACPVDDPGARATD
jgi:hypothetical protein